MDVNNADEEVNDGDRLFVTDSDTCGQEKDMKVHEGVLI